MAKKVIYITDEPDDGEWEEWSGTARAITIDVPDEESSDDGTDMSIDESGNQSF